MNLIDKAIAPENVSGDLLQLLYIPLSALSNLDEVLAQGNPKKHELDKLRASIIQNGFIDPAKWDSNLNGGKGGIIYGNGRTEALVAMLRDMKQAGQQPPRGIGIAEDTGEWCIPVKFGVDAESEIAAKRFIVDHNLLTASGLSVVDASVMFETEAYLELLEELKEADALPISVDEQEYLELIGEPPPSDPPEDDDGGADPTEVELREGLVLGSIWQLGKHRILCGDSTDEGAISLLLEGKTVDSLICDPPYGVDYGSKNEMLNKLDNGKRIETAIENDRIKNYREFFSNFLRIIPFSEYNTFYIFMSDQELHNLRLAIEDCGFKVSSYLVWIKNNHVLGRKDYSSKHEIVLYGWKDKHKFYGEFSTTVLEYDKPLKNEFHPTMKPVELVQRIIADGSPKGGVIFDSFLGSGTTLIAAETMEGNRSVYGFEISPHYCEVIMQRFSKITGEEPVLITTI